VLKELGCDNAGHCCVMNRHPQCLRARSRCHGISRVATGSPHPPCPSRRVSGSSNSLSPSKVRDPSLSLRRDPSLSLRTPLSVRMFVVRMLAHAASRASTSLPGLVVLSFLSCCLELLVLRRLMRDRRMRDRPSSNNETNNETCAMKHVPIDICP